MRQGNRTGGQVWRGGTDHAQTTLRMQPRLRPSLLTARRPPWRAGAAKWWAQSRRQDAGSNRLYLESLTKPSEAVLARRVTADSAGSTARSQTTPAGFVGGLTGRDRLRRVLLSAQSGRRSRGLAPAPRPWPGRSASCAADRRRCGQTQCLATAGRLCAGICRMAKISSWSLRKMAMSPPARLTTRLPSTGISSMRQIFRQLLITRSPFRLVRPGLPAGEFAPGRR